MLDFRTINDVFARMSHRGDATVAWYKDHNEWKPISSRAMYGRVRATVELLRSWGIKRGDRVALVSENRWEWPVVDFAILALGAVAVPLYQTLTPEQMGYILRDSGARAFFISGKQQYAKLLAAGELPAIEHVAVFDEGGFDKAQSFAEALQGAESLESSDAAFDALLAETKP